jgi:hypothetical protein
MLYCKLCEEFREDTPVTTTGYSASANDDTAHFKKSTGGRSNALLFLIYP